jgi:hypothetical protein
MDDITARDKWLSLVSADPFTTSSPATTEIIGGSITRMASSWTRTGYGVLTLASTVSFVGLPAGAHVAGVACFDAAINGTLLFADLLDEPVSYLSGGTYVLAAGQYVVGIDIPTWPAF